jgi:hypothetical protein
MRERPDAGGCCAGPIWRKLGSTLPGGNAADDLPHHKQAYDVVKRMEPLWITCG